MSAKLYFGDNGRITCSDLKCAGMTAHFSKMKRDLSGQRMKRVSCIDAADLEKVGVVVRCETCGARG